MTIELSILIAVIGCFVGVAGLMRNTKNDNSADAEWRGEVKAQLNNILTIVSGLNADISSIRQTVQEHGERLTNVEASARNANKRIDELKNKKGD